VGTLDEIQSVKSIVPWPTSLNAPTAVRQMFSPMPMPSSPSILGSKILNVFSLSSSSLVGSYIFYSLVGS